MKTLYTLRTSAGTCLVEDDGRRWTPGEPLPKGARPNAALALCRNAEAHAQAAEARRPSWRDRRAA